MTTLAVFGIGGWELLLIAVLLSVVVGVPLVIIAIVLLFVNRQKKNALPPSQQNVNPTKETL